MILADELAVILDDRHAHVVALPPVVARIDIMHDNIHPATHERHEFFDQNFAQMAALAAIDIESLQITLLTVGS